MILIFVRYQNLKFYKHVSNLENGNLSNSADFRKVSTKKNRKFLENLKKNMLNTKNSIELKWCQLELLETESPHSYGKKLIKHEIR